MQYYYLLLKHARGKATDAYNHNDHAGEILSSQVLFIVRFVWAINFCLGNKRTRGNWRSSASSLGAKSDDGPTLFFPFNRRARLMVAVVVVVMVMVVMVVMVVMMV